MTLDLSAVADADDGYAERTTDQSRQIWERAAYVYTVEDFDSGGLTGYTRLTVGPERPATPGAGRSSAR
jgi:hypothetical protein